MGSLHQHSAQQPADDALARTIRRHRRALAALEGDAFEGISEPRSEQLAMGIRQEIQRCEQELRARTQGSC